MNAAGGGYTEITVAIGWTLVHSLWQAAVLALLLAITLLFMKRSSSSSRYLISVSALILVVLTSICTFAYFYDTEAVVAQTVINRIGADVARESGMSSRMSPSSFAFGLVGYFEKHIHLVVLFWTMGVLLLLLKFIGGLAYVGRLRNYRTQPVGKELDRVVRNLSSKIGLERKVEVLNSSLVKIPIVVGFLKPVILLPLNALTGFPPELIEAILAHELAHVMRADYLVNILQSLVEIIFFYHPAVWWISGNIREEREHCCDDIAVSASQDSIVFAKALASLVEIATKAPGHVTAVTGKEGNIMKRIRRLLSKSRPTPTFGEGFLSAFALTAILVSLSFGIDALSASAMGADISGMKTEVKDGHREVSVSGRLSRSKKEDSYRIVMNKSGEVQKLFVNGKEVPKKDIGKFKRIIDEVTGNLEAEEKAMAVEMAQMRAEQESMKRDDARMKLEQTRMAKEAARMELEERHMAEEAAKMKLAEEETAREAARMELEETHMADEAAGMKREEELMREEAAEMKKEEKRMAVESKVIEIVRNELVKDGIIAVNGSAPSWNFTIDPKRETLSVNGKVMPPPVYEKYKKIIETTSKVTLEEFTRSRPYSISVNMYGQDGPDNFI